MRTKIIFLIIPFMLHTCTRGAETPHPVTAVHTYFNRIQSDERKTKTLKALSEKIPNGPEKISLATLILKQAVTQPITAQHQSSQKVYTDDDQIPCEYIPLSSADQQELERTLRIINAALRASHMHTHAKNHPSHMHKHAASASHAHHTHHDEEQNTTFCPIL